MAQLEKYFPRLLAFEGGYVDDPSDHGGATNKGITWDTFKRYAKPLLQIEPTPEGLKNLTDAQAFRIYKPIYWDSLHGDEIGDQPLAEIVFDFHVNAGGAAVKLLQRELNNLGAHPALSVDGAFGPATLRALQAADPVELYTRYKAGRRAFYERLAANDPSQAKFLKGWLKRVDSFPDNPER
jgi:lysozyme family protein